MAGLIVYGNDIRAGCSGAGVMGPSTVRHLSLIHIYKLRKLYGVGPVCSELHIAPSTIRRQLVLPTRANYTCLLYTSLAEKGMNITVDHADYVWFVAPDTTKR